MKISFLFIFLSLIPIIGWAQDCPNSEIILNSQEDIDNFSITYPNCTQLIDDLTIIDNSSGSPITSLNSLSQITAIDGFLWLDGCDNLANLNGLNNLTAINSSLRIQSNDLLNDISALNNLQTVGGLFIKNNPLLAACTYDWLCLYIQLNGSTSINNNATGCDSENEVLAGCNLSSTCELDLVFTTQDQIDNFATDYLSCSEIIGNVTISGPTINDLSGLNQLAIINGDLIITNNDILDEINGWTGLTQIDSSLIIEDNPELEDILSITNLTAIGLDLIIDSNPKINDLTGFQSLGTIGRDLAFLSASNLLNFSGLDQLTTIGNNFIINGQNNYNNPLSSMQGLEQLNTIGGDFYFVRSHNLSTFNGLQNLQSIGGSFTVGRYQNAGNNTITNFNGLEGLTSIGEDFIIQTSLHLETLNGLENLTFVGNDIQIRKCNLFNSFVGLSGLTSIPGQLFLEENAALSTLTGLENLTSINELRIHNGVLQNLTGLGNLTSLNSLHISIWQNNSSILVNLNGLEGITSLPGYLYIFNQQLDDLSGLENITTITEDFSVNTNAPDYNVFQNLTNVGGDFSATGNTTTGFNNLTSIGGDFRISLSTNNNPTLAGFNNLHTIGGIMQNITGPTNLIGLSALTTIGGINQNDNEVLVTLEGLENVTTITGDLRINDCGDFQQIIGLTGLTSIGGNLVVTSNPNIDDLVGLEGLTSIGGLLSVGSNSTMNSLDGIQNLQTLGGNITIISNPLLSECSFPIICSLANNANTSIYNNLTGCNTTQEILSNCTNYYPFDYEIYYDVNQNGQRDLTEQGVSNGILELTPPGSNIYISSNDGTATYYAFQGDYNVNFNPASNPNWDLTSTPTSYDITLNATNPVVNASFGIFPNNIVSELTPSINAPGTRCNESITFTVHLNNTGTTITDGTLWLTVDEDITATDFIDQPDISQATNNLYGWNFSDLYPGQHFSKQIALTIPGEQQFIGESLSFTAYADFQDPNGSQTSSTFEYVTPIECAWDPNDKLVIPNRSGNYTLFTEELFYTIRFQNTGNAEAYDVVVRDTLDPNLDWNTFTFLNTSHPDVLNTTLTDDGHLTFEFIDIFLPDSTTNFDGSQGYISYMIRPLTGLAENTPIENTAGIYFDFNPPVITNTTENLMVSVLPVGCDIEVTASQGSATDCILATTTNSLAPITYNWDNGMSTPEICNLSEGQYCVTVTDADACTATVCYTVGGSAGSCSGDLNFTTQQEIDNFVIDNPSCNIVLGNVTIQEAFAGAINNLNGLASISQIDGFLKIQDNTILANLDGLDNLTSVGDYLRIRFMDGLTNINGLNSLQQIGANVLIGNTPLLENLDGLENITTLSGDLDIQWSENLNNLNGLQNLQAIAGNFSIFGHDALGSLGFNSLTSIGGDLTIEGNPILTSLSGFGNITSLGGDLVIKINPQLEVCNYNFICDILQNNISQAYFNGNLGNCYDNDAVLATCSVVNTAPTAQSFTFNMPEDNTFSFTQSQFGYSDVNGDAFFNLKITTLPSLGTFELNGIAITIDQEIGATDIPLIQFTPALNEFLSPYVSFDFQVSDGTLYSDTYTATINVLPVNDIPLSENFEINMILNTTFDFASDDFPFVDVEDNIEGIRINSLPENGLLELNGTVVLLDQTISATDISNLQFTPTTDETGSPYTTFDFSVFDDIVYSESYTATINVLLVDGVRDQLADFNVQLSPNPTDGELNIAINWKEQPQRFTIEVLDIYGRVLAKTEEQNAATTFSKAFDFAHLNPGMYLIRVQKNGKTNTQKFIIK